MRLEFQENKDYKALMYLNRVTSTPEARVYLAKEGYEGIEKLARIADSPLTTLLGIFI
jgi:hypothetical protein